MRIRATIVATAIAAALSVTGAMAQHEEHQKDHAAPPAGKTEAGKNCDMMSGNMTSSMHQMMAAHAETGNLIDQLIKNFEAIEAQNDPETADPARLKEKLAEHGKLLRELQAKALAQSKMMENGKSGGAGK